MLFSFSNLCIFSSTFFIKKRKRRQQLQTEKNIYKQNNQYKLLKNQGK